jgi:putative oxidoreductase
MNVVFTIGRIALVVLFILSGAGKLLDIPGTAALIDAKFTIPAPLLDYAKQLSDAVGMGIGQMLAIAVGVIEFVAGLLVAVGVLTRTAAVLLLIFTAVSTFYGDFYGAEKLSLTTHMLESLSIMGGLLMLAAWPRRLVVEEIDRPEHLHPL